MLMRKAFFTAAGFGESPEADGRCAVVTASVGAGLLVGAEPAVWGCGMFSPWRNNRFTTKLPATINTTRSRLAITRALDRKPAEGCFSRTGSEIGAAFGRVV